MGKVAAHLETASQQIASERQQRQSGHHSTPLPFSSFFYTTKHVVESKRRMKLISASQIAEKSVEHGMSAYFFQKLGRKRISTV